MDEAIHEYIVTRLANHANPDEIVYALCNEHGLSWPEAEAMLESVKNEHATEISRRQTPLMFILAVGLMAAGLVAVGYGIYTLLAFWQVLAVEPPAPPPDRSIVAQIVDNLIRQYDIANNIVFVSNAVPFSIEIILFGVALIAGSFFGMKQVWQAIFEYFEL